MTQRNSKIDANFVQQQQSNEWWLKISNISKEADAMNMREYTRGNLETILVIWHSIFHSHLPTF